MTGESASDSIKEFEMIGQPDKSRKERLSEGQLSIKWLIASEVI